jgi:hypothetical protein
MKFSRIIILLIIYTLHGLPSCCQENTGLADITGLNKYLNYINCGPFLQINDIQSKENTFIITGHVAGKKNWAAFRETFFSANGIYPEEFIFHKTGFNLNIPYSNLVVKLTGVDQNIIITGSDSSVATDFQQKMGDAGDTAVIPTKDIKSISNIQKISAAATFKVIAQKITDSLRNFFLPYAVKDVPVRYTAIPKPYSNELMIEVSRIKKAAIPYPVFWEKYLVSIKFKPSTGNIALYTLVSGQFGPGIGLNESLNYRDFAEDTNSLKSFNSFCERIYSAIQYSITADK